MAAAGTLGWWYCCIHVAERTVLRQTAEGLLLTLFVGLPLPVWDAFWLVTGHNTAEYKQAFRGIYGLEIATIEIEGEAVEVVRPAAGRLPLWVERSVFIFTSSATCLAGCEQSTVP